MVWINIKYFNARQRCLPCGGEGQSELNVIGWHVICLPSFKSAQGQHHFRFSMIRGFHLPSRAHE